MITFKMTPNEGWQRTPKLWTVLKTHVEYLGGEATITDEGLTIKAATAKRTKKDKNGETVDVPTIAEEVTATLTAMYKWTVQDG